MKLDTLSYADEKNAHERVFCIWDGYGLQSPYSGIYQHIFNLYQHWPKTEKPKILIDASWQASLEQAGFARVDLIVLEDFPVRRVAQQKTIWGLRTRSWLLKKLEEDSEGKILFHGFSNYNAPYLKHSRLRTILTLHDLIPLDYPAGVSVSYAWQFLFLMKVAARHTHHWVFVSEATKEAFFKNYTSVSMTHASVIENGYSPIGFPERVEKKENQGPCVLVVSRDEEYKRLDFVCEIFKILPETFTLTVVTDVKGQNRLRKIQEEHSGRIRLLANLSQEELDHEYQRADTFLHTSTVEGFGLPLLRALQHHIPIVVLENVGIARKFSRKVAIFPKSESSTHDWLEAITRALELSHIPGFSEECVSNLRQFSDWPEIAHKIIHLYINEISEYTA